MHTHDTTSNVPAFLIKLWKLVEDSSCDDLIAWSDSGVSFIIKDQSRFASELLPQYFKHNNMASFVRQLNMYGFRKVMNYEKSGLRNENNEMEFQHPFFVKEQSELLELIKRKIPNAKIISEPHAKSDAKDILIDLTSLRDKQENMDNMLLKMKQENELLWKELTTMRQKHKQQEQVIEKVIHFLVQVIRNQPVGVGLQRNIHPMLHDSPNSKGSTSQITTLDVLRNNPECIIVQDKKCSGPVIHEVTESDLEEPRSVGSVSSSCGNPATTSKSFLKSPASNIIILSPASSTNETEQIASVQECPLDAVLSSPVDSSLPIEPLSILEPLQSSTPNMNDEDGEEESVLGIPLEYITATDVVKAFSSAPTNSIISNPTKSAISVPKSSNFNKFTLKKVSEQSKSGNNVPLNNDISNVISIPEGSDIRNVISIPEGSDIGNVISIPEGSDISNIISIPEGSDISNVISIPEGSSIGNIIAVSKNKANTIPDSNSASIPAIRNDTPFSKDSALTLPDFYNTSVCLDNFKLNSISNSVNSPLSKPDFIDPLMSDSLQTPKISLSDDIDIVDFTVGDDKKKQNSTSAFSAPTLDISKREHNYPSSVASSNDSKSFSTKNTLSNHLLIVDEELNRLQDNIATNSWDVDVDKILGLFSSDGIVNNESLVDQLTDSINIKKEPVDILDSELGSLTPQILGVELDELRSPFLNHIDPEMINSNQDEDPQKRTSILDNDSADGSSNENDYLLGRRSKGPKTSKRKRQKLK